MKYTLFHEIDYNRLLVKLIEKMLRRIMVFKKMLPVSFVGLVLFLVIINFIATIVLGYIVWDRGLLDEPALPSPPAPPTVPADPAPSNEKSPTTQPITLPVYTDFTMSGTDVSLRIGQELHVSLDIINSQDYVWSLEENAGTILEFVSSQGDMTSQEWVFKAENKGSSTLKLTYGRMIEGVMQTSERTFSLNVTVQ